MASYLPDTEKGEHQVIMASYVPGTEKGGGHQVIVASYLPDAEEEQVIVVS